MSEIAESFYPQPCSISLLPQKRYMPISAGSIILKYLNDNDIRKRRLAEKINLKDNTLQGRLNSQHMSTDFIVSVSKALNHDFFADLSAALRQEMKLEEIQLSEADSPYGKIVGRSEYDALLKENLELLRKIDRLRDRLEKAEKPEKPVKAVNK